MIKIRVLYFFALVILALSFTLFSCDSSSPGDENITLDEGENDNTHGGESSGVLPPSIDEGEENTAPLPTPPANTEGVDNDTGDDDKEEGEDADDSDGKCTAVFDDLSLGQRIDSSVISSGNVRFNFNMGCDAVAEIVSSPFCDENALKFSKNDTQRGGTLTFYAPTDIGERIVLEFDFMMESCTTTVPIQINLGTSYRLQISTDAGYMMINDSREDGSHTNYLGGYRKYGLPISMRVEYYFGDGTAAGQYAKVYIDGALVAISQNSYYSEPRNTVPNVKFYSLKLSDATYYLDNLSIFSDDACFVDDGGEGCRYYLLSGTSADVDWALSEDILGKESVEALKELSDIFDDRFYVWLANLYDPLTSAFYYSNDARDFIDFLPDAESTEQALCLMQNIGLCNAEDLYTDEMAANLVSWVQAMQSSDDGYFYHSQWGEDIPIGRLGRDLGWCINILKRFDAEPLYPTALDRLSGTASTSSHITKRLTASTVRAVSYVVFANATAVNAHLRSESAFISYLDGLYEQYTTYDQNGNEDINSYSLCGAINSQISQIKAAGLADVCVDYMNQKQNSETGLWESVANYRSASGFLKISSAYNNFGRMIPNADKAAASLIDVINSEEGLTDAVYVYNPISGLSNLINNLKKFSTDPSAYELYISVIEEMRASSLSVIDNTKRKLEQFKREDGSFSYFTKGSAGMSSGVVVCYGRDEGDVNGSGLVNSTITNLCTLFGMKRPAHFDADDFAAFADIIYNKEPIEKISPLSSVIDFESSSTMPVEITIAIGSEGSASLVREEGNTSLEVATTAGAGDTVRIMTGERSGDISTYVFSAEVEYVAVNNTVVSQIFFGDKNILAFNILHSSGSISVIEHTSAGKGNTLISGIDASCAFNIRVEYYPTERHAEITVSTKDKVLRASTNAYYDEANINAYYNVAKFYMLKNAVGTVRLDNIEAYAVTP